MNKKATKLVLVFGCLLMLLSACGQNSSQDTAAVIKDTPRQIGSKGFISSTVKGYTFSDLVKEADIIAKVEINGWLKETTEPIQKTFFNAKLVNTYKNTISTDLKEITIMQRGNSEFTIKSYPLFKNNDTLVLFLKKATDLDNTYWILGEHTTVLKTCTIDNSEYIIKELGDYPELNDIQVKENEEKVKIKNEIKKDMIEFTSLEDSNIPQSFKKEQFDEKIKNYLK